MIGAGAVFLMYVLAVVEIAKGECGIENMDAKYLAEDLIENEPELFEYPIKGAVKKE